MKFAIDYAKSFFTKPPGIDLFRDEGTIRRIDQPVVFSPRLQEMVLEVPVIPRQSFRAAEGEQKARSAASIQMSSVGRAEQDRDL